MYTKYIFKLPFTIQCLNIKRRKEELKYKELQKHFYSLKGFVLLWTIWIGIILEEVVLSVENTAVLLPEMLLAGGKDEGKTENGTCAT